ncbi:MAG: hypothetical protein V1737_06490, partial [Chloroflexota bacterium]
MTRMSVEELEKAKTGNSDLEKVNCSHIWRFAKFEQGISLGTCSLCKAQRHFADSTERDFLERVSELNKKLAAGQPLKAPVAASVQPASTPAQVAAKEAPATAPGGNGAGDLPPVPPRPGRAGRAIAKYYRDNRQQIEAEGTELSEAELRARRGFGKKGWERFNHKAPGHHSYPASRKSPSNSEASKGD